MPLRTGTRVGAYEIRGPLGSGGMGEVYLAWDGRLGREVAVQVRGLPADARSDISALGAVLYEMLARRRAFTGETTSEIETAILRSEPPDLTAVDGQIPTTLDRIVRRCLEKRPEDRFQTAPEGAVSLAGRERLVARIQGDFELHRPGASTWPRA